MVALSKRMSKRRCRSCPGRDGCLHVRIYDEKKNPPEKKEEDVEQKEGEKAVVEREKEEDDEEKNGHYTAHKAVVRSVSSYQ